MELVQPLPLLALSALESSTTPITRYGIMTKINHVSSPLDSPYSPGAIYYAIKSLLLHGLIINNQQEYAISSAGRAALHQIITTAPLPSSWLHCTYRMIVADSCVDQKIRQIGLQRISVELIKNSHLAKDSPAFERDSAASDKALNICRSHMSHALQKAILDLVANK